MHVPLPMHHVLCLPSQGTYTPRLEFAGHSSDGCFFLLLTSRVIGWPLGEGDARLLPAALAALRAVHAAGLRHGDVRLPNFMVTRRGMPGMVRVWLGH